VSPHPLTLSPDRCFDSDPAQRRAAEQLYALVRDLPLVCPHGHVDPRLFADPSASWGSPADLLIIPDHYVFRMLYSQGVSLDDLGVPAEGPAGGPAGAPAATPADHRAIWRRFAEKFYLFRGTPTGLWLAAELAEVFGIKVKLDAETADATYDQLVTAMAQPDCRPRALFERFNIETMCTTDPATSTLAYHRQIAESDWGTNPATGKPRIRPTFRPDKAINLDAPGWRAEIDALGQVCGREITSYAGLIRALQERRAYFKEMGATATDHAALTPFTEELPATVAETVFVRALHGKAEPGDAARFMGHMLMEMARMSIEDGLVMQLHAGSLRDHNPAVYQRFGTDKGADIPVATEWTRNLRPLLAKYGNDSRLTLVLFGLDESTYSRELAPLAGHYPALRLGPPWWFFDSLAGMRRYFDQVMETTGLYNTAGFNDDTRAFPSIPARHDVWRRAAADWLAGLLVRGLIDENDAEAMIVDAAYRLAKETYRL
jgi:glucuronate isomerase